MTSEAPKFWGTVPAPPDTTELERGIEPVQTFLPYRSFISSARVLDGKRLWKQRVETMQIMQALRAPHEVSKARVNHPVVKMWRGYENALMSYQNVIIAEGLRRGYTDNVCAIKTAAYFMLAPYEERLPRVPWWLGKKFVHSAHRANLLRKDPVWYGQFGWLELPRDGYDYPEPRPLELP